MNIYRRRPTIIFLLVLAGIVLGLPGARAQQERSGSTEANGGQPPFQSGSVLAANCIPDDAFEDNDTLNTAAVVTPGTYSPLILCSSDPNDFFAIDIPAGHTLQANLTYAATNGNIVLRLYDETGTQVIGSTNGSAQMTVAETDTYYVAANYTSGSINYTLRLRISCADCFSFQGRLDEASIPASGDYDFQFRLYDDVSDGQLVAGPITRTVTVTGGFLAVDLYFGDTTVTYGGIELGESPYLEMRVRPNGDSGPFTILSPRQQLLPAPLAHTLRPGAVISGTAIYPASGMLTLLNNRGNGLAVDMASSDGVKVASAFNGLRVLAAGHDGVLVNAAENNGFYVGTAGNPSEVIYSGFSDGIEVAGAEGFGLAVGRADVDGVRVTSAGQDGVRVFSAFDDGLHVDSARNGVRVVSALDGIHVESAYNGVHVLNSPNYGILVDHAGSGVVVNEAVFHGFAVGTAGEHGVQVLSASEDGIRVSSSGNYAGNFAGNVFISGSCTGCLLAAFGLNDGQEPIQPGDIVAILGTTASAFFGTEVLFHVTPAAPGLPLLGVVQGYAEVISEEREGLEPIEQLVPGVGPAEPGDYVSVVIYGPVQIAAAKVGTTIAPGDRIAVDDTGKARSLQRFEVTTVDGSVQQMVEATPTLGTALGQPDENGLVWVLVNPR